MEFIQRTTPIWYTLNLKAGEDLFQVLKDFFKREDLEEAHLLSCIGSLEKVVLAYPKTKTIPPEIETVTLEGLFEINGISGNIKREAGEIKVHLHGSVSKAGREVSGGAIVAGTKIFKMAEWVIIGFKK
jgi:predicted DNA-binding protein with PD1-like motif